MVYKDKPLRVSVRKRRDENVSIIRYIEVKDVIKCRKVETNSRAIVFVVQDCGIPLFGAM